uniref:Uncharacterized protein n=1 Tax=Arundo donax TaxID=35708 RepID=A0A0A8YPX1_ARUDO
MAIGIVEVRLQ